ncbi:MAG: lactate utilization protein [Deltaproteobacteria bacterium]|nr:lactate utilization protein [Deltaproteobacteria bacterium]
MKIATHHFKDASARAVLDLKLQDNLLVAGQRFAALRQMGMARLVDPAAGRRAARDLKRRCLADLPRLLTLLESKLQERGVVVHWALNGGEARRIILDLAAARGVKSVVKGKSMMSEEVGLNPALAEAGVEVWESDLGEFIVQLAGEGPSHILAPAIHKNRQDVAELFHQELGLPYTEEPAELTLQARRFLREKFLAADMGVTGVNVAIAETGSLCLFENEGNIRMSTTLPRLHVAVMGLEKVVETWEDFDQLRMMLTLTATGQACSTYLSLLSGPRRAGEKDGPEEVHVIFLDNRRSHILADPVLRDTLQCIRCGACLNVCPVYQSVGGYTYGWVYSGPIGVLLNSQLLPRGLADDLPRACTMCGACAQVCPVMIDHPSLMLHLRWLAQGGETPQRGGGAGGLAGVGLHSWLAGGPARFRAAHALARLGQPLVAPGGRARRRPKVLARWGEARVLPRLQKPFSRRWRRLQKELARLTPDPGEDQ